MTSLDFARRPSGTETIDLCSDCQALWFDAFESAQLTPGATLDLFRVFLKDRAERKEAEIHHPRLQSGLIDDLCRYYLTENRELHDISMPRIGKDAGQLADEVVHHISSPVIHGAVTG